MWKCDRDNSSCSDLKTRDLLYLIAVLVIIIIGIAIAVFANQENVFNYFSFASTITSIILSVLAIFMTLISEYKNEFTKAKIDNAVMKIDDSTDKLGKLQKELKEELPNYDNLLREIKKVLDHMNNIERAVGVKTEDSDFNDGKNKQITFSISRDDVKEEEHDEK